MRVLGNELIAAKAEGLEAFDSLRFRFVCRLAEYAERGDEGSERLTARAANRLQALRDDFLDAKKRAEVLTRRMGGECPPYLHELLSAGDLRTFFRVAARPPRRAAKRIQQLDVARLEKRVARRSTLPPPAMSDALALAAQLYGERSGAALTRRAMAVIREDLPVDAGPYHGTTVAADALESLNAHSLPLLRAWLQKLRNLDALRGLDS